MSSICFVSCTKRIINGILGRWPPQNDQSNSRPQLYRPIKQVTNGDRWDISLCNSTKWTLSCHCTSIFIKHREFDFNESINLVIKRFSSGKSHRRDLWRRKKWWGLTIDNLPIVGSWTTSSHVKEQIRRTATWNSSSELLFVMFRS